MKCWLGSDICLPVLNTSHDDWINLLVVFDYDDIKEIFYPYYVLFSGLQKLIWKTSRLSSQKVTWYKSD